MSSLSPIVQNLLEKNASFVETFTPAPSMQEYAARLVADPSIPRICIITCADPRVIPEHIFNLSMGEALVIRVAGGSIQPSLSSILAIDTLFGFTDVIVMRHTDCGTSAWTDEGIKQKLEERCGTDRRGLKGRAGERVVDMAFCESVGDMSELLKEDVNWLKQSPLIRGEMKKGIVGMMFDVKTGRADVVC